MVESLKELVEGEGEELSGRDNDLGEEATPVGVEEPIQRPADGVVGQPFGLLPPKPEALGREGVHHLCQPVDGLPLREDGSQKDPEPLGVGQAAAGILGRDEVVQKIEEPQAVYEVIDQGEGSKALVLQLEARLFHAYLLTLALSCDIIIAR